MTDASIVIVTHGQWGVTERCLRSLESSLGDKLGKSWEVVVVDNDSPDETPHRLKDWSDRIRVELLSQNTNFAGGCNVGATLASGETIVFLNNDTEVPLGALETLVEQTHEPEVAAAGCRLVFPDGTVQHAGVAFIRSRLFNGVAFPQHIFHHQDQTLAATQASYETDCVTAACLAVTRTVFSELGGFDEAYRNGMEDVDLCLRIRAAGHRIVYRGDVTLVHHEGASRGRGESLWATPEKLAAMRHNDELFAARWGPLLDQDDELATYVWDALLRDRGPERTGQPGRVALVGPAAGLGPVANEARGMLALLRLCGWLPAAFTYPATTIVPRLSDDDYQLTDGAERATVPTGSPVIHLPGGPSDRPALEPGQLTQPAIVRLAQTETALRLADFQAVWAASPYLRSALIDAGVSAERVHVVPPPITARKLGAGGRGVLVVLPVQNPAVATVVLRSLQSLPPGIEVRVLPTMQRRGWERELAETAPGAQALSPNADETRFASLAAEADLVIAADSSDLFERPALIAASVGTHPISLNEHGTVRSALGHSAVSGSSALASQLLERLAEPLERTQLANLVRTASAQAAQVVSTTLSALGRT